MMKRQKNPKLQLCGQHFLLEALSIHQPPNIVPPKEHAVGTAAILDFLVRIRSTGQSLIAPELKFLA